MSKLTKEDKALIARMGFLRELLKEFGATLAGYDPGVTAFLPDGRRGNGYMGESLAFDGNEWAWLEPLLLELRGLRAAVKAAATKVKAP